MLLSKPSLKKAESGAILVEFAIIVPLLLLLLVGITEFAFAFYNLNILNKSVQDAARYFANPELARNGAINASINVTTATTGNGTNITKTINLVIYGNTSGTGNPLMPNAANYTSPNPPYYVYCAEENTYNAVCSTTTNHIRVTAVYKHNFILGNVLNNFTRLGISNPITLTASSVQRVE